LKKAPISWPYHSQSYSLPLAEWMPVKPPPAWMYRSNAARWSAFRIGPLRLLVLLKTTTSYCARVASVKFAASSLATTSKLCSVASFCSAATPYGLDSWSKPLIFEKTSALNLGSAAVLSVAAAVAPAPKGSSATITAASISNGSGRLIEWNLRLTF
jgi:hypothetical protein